MRGQRHLRHEPVLFGDLPVHNRPTFFYTYLLTIDTNVCEQFYTLHQIIFEFPHVKFVYIINFKCHSISASFTILAIQYRKLPCVTNFV